MNGEQRTRARAYRDGASTLLPSFTGYVKQSWLEAVPIVLYARSRSLHLPSPEERLKTAEGRLIVMC